ncbi:hypothetical protein J4557_40400 [Actinomadura nitritigenes]|uniref:DUF91 domain-containing protein n=3 Tax=Actinomadura nitritigenes TaxID=134602 RepID=A0ABS3RC47_9ACTN|nr:hypothetical protein [Actinomadura nitritigenes]MBO2443804.1 hypothetical protein [Actinomadura nitritigenes]
MVGIWHETSGGLVALRPEPFEREQVLHDSIERGAAMLPLPGQPTLVMLGREVQLGNGYADLIAIEVETGRPVVIEVKLASNADRRQVFTQTLGYASYLFGLSVDAFEQLLRPHLARGGHASIAEAVVAGVGDGSVDAESLNAQMAQALEEGRFRCVVVLDTAPADLIELTGFLQAVTNDRLDIDVVTVAAYTVEGTRVLVPQLVEPERTAALALAAAPVRRDAKPAPGAQAFADSIDQAGPEHRELLRRLLDWARHLEAEDLAVLYTTIGKGRWVLNPRLPGQGRGLVTIWNDGGAFVSPQRSVFQTEAPRTLAHLDERLPGEIRQNNYLTSPIDQDVLALLTDAYKEARIKKSES